MHTLSTYCAGCTCNFNTQSYPITGWHKKWTMMKWSGSQRWTGRREMKSTSMMAIERSSRAVSRLGPTDMSGCGSTLAVSTSEAAQSYPRPSIPCIGGMKMQRYAMHTCTMSPIHDFPLRGTMRGIPTSVDGQSGSCMGGHYKS